MAEWIYSVCLWSIKSARFDHDSYDQCKKSNLMINQSKVYLCFQLKNIHQLLITLIVKKPLSNQQGPLKSIKSKFISGPCYMIKCVLTFVSGVQESVLVDSISQNFV